MRIQQCSCLDVYYTAVIESVFVLKPFDAHVGNYSEITRGLTIHKTLVDQAFLKFSNRLARSAHSQFLAKGGYRARRRAKYLRGNRAGNCAR